MYTELSDMRIKEFAFMIIVLAQYLYAECCIGCRTNNGKYIVYEKDVSRNLSFAWKDYGYRIIQLRNELCHRYGSAKSLYELNRLYSSREEMKGFLEYLGLREAVNLSSALDDLANFK